MSSHGVGRLRGAIRWGADLFKPRAAILLYHRVTELDCDPQLLGVSRQHFAEHLESVRRLCYPTRLSRLTDALRRHRGRTPAVAITFDDGYADNLYNAKPLLDRYDTPATVFVATGYIKSQREFWQDELAKIFLAPGRLPQTLELAVKGHSYRWDLGTVAEYGEASCRDHCGWNVLCAETPTPRQQLYRSLCDILFPLDAADREECLADLFAWSQIARAARPTHSPLSEGELVRLGEGKLVEIGGHTVSHAALSYLSEAEQRSEISDSKEYLEDILASPVTSFAYPYGGRSDYSDQTVMAVRHAGFKLACSNFSGVVRLNSDPWQLPRFLVRDWPGEVFLDRLKQWFSEGL